MIGHRVGKYQMLLLMVSFLPTVLLCGCEAGIIQGPAGAGPECNKDSECDDGNVCTDDGCDQGVCRHTNNQAKCDDGQTCSLEDACENGICVGAGAVGCDDNNPCTTDGCSDQNGCTHVPNTLSCDDGNACTQADACSDGACAGSNAILCTASDSCHDVGTCNPENGICSNPAKQNGAPCDDGDACTQTDTCQGGACTGLNPVVCTASDSCHEVGTCNPADGTCTNPAKSDDTACNDGDSCTRSDTCQGGACTGSNRIPCAATDSCHDVGVCNPANGICSDPAKPDGTSCDDGNACTQPDTCQSGLCTGPMICAGCGNTVCDAGENMHNCPADCTLDLAVIVQDSLSGGLMPSLDQYSADLRVKGKKVHVVSWVPGTAAALRALIAAEVNDYGVKGAFLIGNLPAAWYAKRTFDTYDEEFPVDVYLMDLDATWTDTNADGKYESHSALNADIFTSRANGTLAELQAYFARLHTYRTTGSLVNQSAWVFLDDDWSGYSSSLPFGLNAIYTTTDSIYDKAETTAAAYMAKLTGTGAEYVYQWIHSTPGTLYVRGTGGDTISVYDLRAANPKGSFYNLFDCEAARFTQLNLGMTYVLGIQNGYGLASIGSTKLGGIYYAQPFHARLAAGETWGEAYRFWYNDTGKSDDDWFLGIVILGDPMLTIQGDVRGIIAAMPAPVCTKDQLDDLKKKMIEFGRTVKSGTFDEYRLNNPQFFQK
jgi:hypothetical protein